MMLLSHILFSLNLQLVFNNPMLVWCWFFLFVLFFLLSLPWALVSSHPQPQVARSCSVQLHHVRDHLFLFVLSPPSDHCWKYPSSCTVSCSEQIHRLFSIDVWINDLLFTWFSITYLFLSSLLSYLTLCKWCWAVVSASQTWEKVNISYLLDRVGMAKSEELKVVKLEEEEEEEQEAAVLDLSISHASNSASVLPTSKQRAPSSVQPSSPAYSGSSDSESTDLLAKRTLPGPAGVLTVHSYARGDASGSDNETSGKKASATGSVNEQELAEVWMAWVLKAWELQCVIMGLLPQNFYPYRLHFHSIPVCVVGCLVVSLFYNATRGKDEHLTFFTLLENKEITCFEIISRFIQVP